MKSQDNLLAQIWNQRWPLLAFALAFQLLENLLFTPAMGLLGRALQGRPVVDSTALVGFFLSPRGFLVLFLGAIISLTIRLVEHAGLSAMVLGALEGKTFRAWAMFPWLATELRRLVAIGIRIFGLSLILAIPLLAVGGLLVPRLLKQHDINYYLANRPSEFVLTAIVIGVVAAATVAVAFWLFVRWRLVVQACVFDRLGGREAFREAAALSRGVRRGLAGRSLMIAAVLLVLVLVAAGLQQLVVWLVLHVAGLGELSLAVSFAVIVLLDTLIGAVVTSLGACADAAVFTAFYRSRRLQMSGKIVLPLIEPGMASSISLPRWAKGLAAAMVLAVLVAAGVSVAVAIDALGHEGPIAVTAHRGGHQHAPENTAGAIREAIAAGANFAEIDVQLSRDGVVVVTHDSDFSRMGGVAKKVWELTYAEIRAIPLGAKSAPEFRNEPAPTLDEVLSIARDRIKLNIELKYYGDPQPQLVERVLAEVQAHQMINQVIVQSLDYEPLLHVQRLAPGIPVGYLMSVNARHPERLNVDFLAVQLDRVTGPFVQAAHRRGQQVHAWTVDAPADIERMIDVGADSLITDQSAEAVRRVRAYNDLSRGERAMRRMNAWLKN
jgi:glycerophosphoryl diester phosphodiesterase